MATMHVDRAGRGFSRFNFIALAGRTLGSVPPPAQVLVGIVSVQVGAAVAKQLFGAVGSAGTVALRLFFAAVVLLVIWRPSLRGMSRRTWAVVVGYGVVLGGMNLGFYLALAKIPLGIAVTIEFLGPLVVALAGSRRWLDGLWAVLAGGGVVLLTQGRGELQLAGILFALLAGLCWGLYILLGAALGRHTSEGNGLALGMVVAAVIAVPVGVADGGSALLDPPVLILGLLVALLSSVVPYSLELEALRRIPPRVFGILLSLEPAVAALVGLVVLSESLRPMQWVAVLCVVGASVGATRTAQLRDQ
jgi:inner membrane transporter RhtA